MTQQSAFEGNKPSYPPPPVHSYLQILFFDFVFSFRNAVCYYGEHCFVKKYHCSLNVDEAVSLYEVSAGDRAP